MSEVLNTEVTEVEGLNLRKILKRIGPSFITMSTTFGPSSMLLAGTAGALYGYKLMWVLPVILLVRILFLDLAVKVGINIPWNLWTTVAHLWGRKLAIVAGIIGFLSLAYYTSANVLGTAASLQLVFGGGSIVVWGLFAMVLAILMYSLRGIYKRIEGIALILVVVMLVSFIGTLLVTGINLGELIRGLIPRSLTAPMLLLALALFATSGTGTSYFHTYWVRGKHYTKADIPAGTLDHVLSTIFMVLINGAIMVVGAEVLNPAHLVPKAAPQFATMLQPLIGGGAKYLFALGLFGAAFTSLVGAPLQSAISLADGFQRANLGLESPFVKKAAIILVVVMGLWGVIPVALGVPFINMLWIGPLASLFGMPLAGTLMLLIARRKDIMKTLPLKNIHYVILWVLFGAMVVYSCYSGLKTLIPLIFH